MITWIYQNAAETDGWIKGKRCGMMVFDLNNLKQQRFVDEYNEKAELLLSYAILMSDIYNFYFINESYG